ncbi:MAG TPA: hypothetical protein VII12_12450 [Thermoanaerobaculia bacterium]|jgi:hypothetical protein
MGVRRALTRRRRIAAERICARCGQPLVQQEMAKYDPFWTTALIFAGALLAFYLVGVAMIFAGLWMRRRKTKYWVCPACVTTSPVPTFP